MKKLFAIALAIAMIATLSVTAFATTAEIEELDGTALIPVSGTFNESGYTDAYYVSLEYTDLAFTYNAKDYTWNPDTLKWEQNANESGWVSTTATINVTNKSSVGITATFTNSAPANGATVSYSNEGKVVLAEADKADKTATGEATTGTMTVTVGGELTATGKICDITVTITETREAV